MKDRHHSLLVGTSGFSYPDWLGSWYPAGLPRRAMLDYYAEHFNAVELNAPYYSTPTPASARRMVGAAEGRLFFTVKAPGDLTHRGLAGPGVVLPFREFLEPFEEGGCLGPILLQFPASFRRTRENIHYLRVASEQLGGLTLAVEFRSDTWDGAPAEECRGAIRVLVDQPELRGLSASLAQAPDGGTAYFRFHGRNAGSWNVRDAGHGRYLYRYGREELAVLARAVRKADERARTTLAFFNNHPDGNAADNAEQLRDLLGLPAPAARQRDLFGEE